VCPSRPRTSLVAAAKVPRSTDYDYAHPRFEFHLCLRIAFWRELEHEVHRVPGLRAIALPEPRQDVAYRIDGRTDGLGTRLHEINVLGISQRLLEQEFVNRPAASEGNLPPSAQKR
jgi:hypothetical protein